MNNIEKLLPLFDIQGKLNRYVESLDQDIEKLKKT